MSEGELSKYYSTLLHLEKLTLVDDVDVDKEGTATNGSTSNQGNKVIRWNFPLLGEVYLTTLREFFESIDVNVIQARCLSNPAFAGYWYEYLYFDFLGRGKAFKVVTDDGKMELLYDGVIDITMVTTLEPGKIYEMKSFYPIVDAVGYLPDASGCQWLVFIQVSLSCYVDHRSLCDLFKRASLKAKMLSIRAPTNSSLFTYYNYQYDIHSTLQNAILLYISPRELHPKGVLLPKLKEEVNKHSKVCENLKYGAFVEDSKFQLDSKK